jgi:hypothetical protein
MYLWPKVTNSLLRIEKWSAALRPPFERPRDDLDFWVLEIRLPADPTLDKWSRVVIRVLARHRSTLVRLRKRGARLVLFVETTTRGGPAHFEPTLLSRLATLGIALEHY